MRRPLDQRFWEKVDRSGGPEACWPWTAYIARTGYGMFTVEAGWVTTAHRIAWELTRDPVPPGRQLDHLCRNRSCVNPAHLEPVSSRENTMRGLSHVVARANQEVCLRGHPLSGENVYVHPRRGTRHCRECARERRRERDHRRRRSGPG